MLLDDGETKYVFFFLGGGSDISSIESHEISATDSSQVYYSQIIRQPEINKTGPM